MFLVEALHQLFLTTGKESGSNSRANLIKVILIDETWVNAGHSFIKRWTDHTLEGTYTAPTCRGVRLILCLAGTSLGFVKGTFILFKSKNTGDYHEWMHLARFEKWFEEQFLPNIQPNSNIIIDNALYHSVQVYKWIGHQLEQASRPIS